MLAHVLAGATDGLYGYVEWLSRQVLPDSAEEEYLERHASIWLEDGRKPAKASSGGVIVEGPVGVTVPIGTQFVRSDGVQFAATNEVTLAALTATVHIQGHDGRRGDEHCCWNQADARVPDRRPIESGDG